MSKQYLKGLVSGIIITILLTSAVFASTKAIDVLFNGVNIEVNGQKVAADNILYNGTTYVPLRVIAEMLGMEVGWIQQTSTATLTGKAAHQAEVQNNNANVLKLISITSPIAPGAEASLTIEGAPNAKYSILIADPSMEKLDDKVAGEDGKVTWTWKLSQSIKPGMYVITVFNIDSGQVLTTTLLVE